MCMEVLEVWGLSNDNDIERCCLTIYHSVGQRMRAYFDNMKTFCQLYLGVLNPDILIDGVKFDAWIPAPTALAELGNNTTTRIWGLFDLLALGCRAYLRVGRDDDAAELAKLAISPDQHTLKKSELMSCHSILGEVAAKRKQLEEADGHFANALEMAKQSGLPMLEVVTAREWKKHLLEPNGRDVSVAEAVIDGACLKMKKSRMEVASVVL